MITPSEATLNSDPDQPLSTLHVVPGATFGGPHNEIARLKPAMAAAGYTAIVVLPREPGSAATRLETHGVRTIQQRMVRLRRVRSIGHWAWYPIGFTRDVIALSTLIRRERIAIVHGYGPNLQAAVAARLAGTPVVWSLLDIGAPAPLRWLIGQVLPILARSVLLDGHAMAAYYPGVRRMGERAIVYYPPVDLAAFMALDKSARADRDQIVVGTLANLNPDKGLETFIDAAALLASRTNVRFEVYGSTHATHLDYAIRLAKRATTVAGDRFVFKGETSDPSRALASLDIFVISSIREGTTSTALEAMACGLPVVATSVGGVPEIVVHGETGLLVDARAPAQLAEAIGRLIDDPALRRLFGLNGRVRVEHEYGLERTALAFEEAYGVALGA